MFFPFRVVRFPIERTITSAAKKRLEDLNNSNINNSDSGGGGDGGNLGARAGKWQALAERAQLSTARRRIKRQRVAVERHLNWADGCG